MKRRNWRSMSDAEIVIYGKDNSLFGKSPSEIQSIDSGYYCEIKKRGIVDDVCKRERLRWIELSDAEIIEYTKKEGLFGIRKKDAKEKNYRLYCEVYKRGLQDSIFTGQTTRWREMNDDSLIDYAKQHDLFGLTVSEMQRKNLAFYDVIRRRNLTDKISMKRLKEWKHLSARKLVEYGKTYGLFGLTIEEAKKKDSKYVNTVRDRKLTRKIFTILRTKKWEKLKDEEIIQYGLREKLFGLNATTVKTKDPGYYNAVIRRGLSDKVFKSNLRSWKDKSNSEIIEYAKRNDLYGLSPSDVQKRDAGYYVEVRKRELVDAVFKRSRKEATKRIRSANILETLLDVNQGGTQYGD